MIIKTYKAPTFKEAMANAKAELGPDAVLLHESRTKKGGLLGFGGKEIVEVIVAVEEPPQKKPVKRAGTRKGRGRTQATRNPVVSNSSEITTAPADNIDSGAVSPEPVVSPAISRRMAASQYQTAGTQQSVDNAQEKAEKYDAGLNTSSPYFKDIMSSLERIKAAEDSIGKTERILSDIKSVDIDKETVSRAPRIIKPMARKSSESATSLDNAQLISEAVNTSSNRENTGVSGLNSDFLKTDSIPRSGNTPVAEIPAEVLAQAAKASEIEAEREKLTEAIAQAEKQAEVDQDQIQFLQNELEEMKEALARMSTGSGGADEITIQQAMRNCDVDDKVIQDMVRKLTGAEIMENKNSDKAHKILEKYLKKTVRVASGITLLSDKPKIVALVGPTGVGKTTTLAKIAAKFVLESGVSAAIITADTYRISAVDQLKTYSDILGLPLEIVISSDALQQAIKKHSDKKLILIDTAGRSQFNDFQMKELCDLLDVDADIEKHLVLSSTTKNRDAEEILTRFSACQPERVIFTKTDETSSLGILLNLLYKRKIALSYVTNGQSVPDDIIPASFAKLADMLLR